MNWNAGFSAAYYATIVDKATWRDISRFEITDGSISRTDDELRCSADISVAEFDYSTEHWIRVYMDARQGQETVHMPLFTGLTSAPTRKIEGSREELSIECYSVLKPAQDILLERGWYAPSEMSGSRIVKSLLKVIPAPIVEDENSPTLKEAIVAEDGESNLTMIDKILTAIGWRLRVEGDGTVRICPAAVNPSASFDPLENDAVEPSVEVEQDWFDCPNVFRAVSDDLSAVARDDSERSTLSTVNRGREVWLEETSCDLNNGETIAEYALRRLKEEQKVGYQAKYTRRFNPDIMTSDIVRLHFPEQNIDGNFRITSQSMSFEAGGRTSEEVVRI